MDPHETLKQIGGLCGSRDTQQEAEELCCDLKEWLVRGGFDPDWAAYPEGAAFFRQWEDDTANPDDPVTLEEAADWQERTGGGRW